MYFGAMAAAWRPFVLFAGLFMVAACSPDLPDAALWKKVHNVYPNVSSFNAAAACRNQSGSMFGQLHGNRSEELYTACMEAFGFVQLTPSEATATAAQ